MFFLESSVAKWLRYIKKNFPEIPTENRMERKVFGNSFGNSQALEILHLSVNLEIQELFCSIRHFQSLLLAHKHSNAASTKVQDGGVTIA